MSAELIGMILATLFLCAMSACLGWHSGFNRGASIWRRAFDDHAKWSVDHTEKVMRDAYNLGRKAASHDPR